MYSNLNLWNASLFVCDDRRRDATQETGSKSSICLQRNDGKSVTRLCLGSSLLLKLNKPRNINISVYYQ